MNYIKIKQETEARIYNFYFGISVQELFVCLFAFFSNYFLGLVFGENIALFGGGVVAVMIFAATYYILFMLKEKRSEIST